MSDITLRAEDAIELFELLEFIHDWTTADRLGIGASLARFAPGYDLEALRADLARFAFLLGGNGEHLIHGPEES